MIQNEDLLAKSAPEMLQLLVEANVLLERVNSHPKSTSARIREMLSRFGMDKEPEWEVVGTAADLIR